MGIHSSRYLLLHDSKEEMDLGLAHDLLSFSLDCVSSRGEFNLFLAGGSSPRGLHRRLAREPFLSKMPWERMNIFWSDERFVDSSSEQSNYGNAKRDFLDLVEPHCRGIYPMASRKPVEGEVLEDWVEAYESLIGSLLDSGRNLDLAFLGIGDDGHTASLFPGSHDALTSEALTSDALTSDPLVRATRAPSTARVRERVSLSLRGLSLFDWIFFLIVGEKKQRVFTEILASPQFVSPYPAAQIRGREGLVYHVDGSSLQVDPSKAARDIMDLSAGQKKPYSSGAWVLAQ